LENAGRTSPQRKGTKRKIRLRFEKRGEIRFLSHLELAHLFYRASRRADLALCYSEGFHPMPRIVFSTALPVGMESMNEVVELEIGDRMNPLDIKERLNQTLPEGIRITEAAEVPLSFSSSSIFHRSVYWIRLDPRISKVEADAKIREALEKETLLVVQERKEKRRSIDILPLIEKIRVKASVQSEESSGRILRGEDKEEGNNNGWGIELVLRWGSGGTAKPSEVIGAILGLEGELLTQIKVIKLE
jgi:radical SAM-linked protein